MSFLNRIISVNIITEVTPLSFLQKKQKRTHTSASLSVVAHICQNNTGRCCGESTYLLYICFNIYIENEIISFFFSFAKTHHLPNASLRHLARYRSVLWCFSTPSIQQEESALPIQPLSAWLPLYNNTFS